MNQRAQEVDELDDGEAWLDSDEVVNLDVKKPLDVALQLRLPGEKWAILCQEAAELGVEPSILLRMWVFDRLRTVQRARSTA
ncbi:MAG: hypothetical protein NTZ05_13060 [Chloroflexi bacterium]|nr:hypothetical protein [Chloroflexota bacterium]